MFLEICPSVAPAAPICSAKCIEFHDNPIINTDIFSHRLHFTDTRYLYKEQFLAVVMIANVTR